jgi:spore maturation protein CgeB
VTQLNLVVFGLSISSAWGNGHATLWRGLCRALHEFGHRVTFFERDFDFYEAHRDFSSVDYCELVLYREWSSVSERAARALDRADAAIVTSFCADPGEARAALFDSRAALKIFYDLDTPVTLDCLQKNGACPYVGAEGLGDFDLVLSFAGGRALSELETRLKAKVAVPLYGSVDPSVHAPITERPRERAALSYLGTYAEDRREGMERLFFEPARQLPSQRFVFGGSLYPEGLTFGPNVHYRGHVRPEEHPRFFGEARFTLNLTRRAMMDYGYCPSGRLFEAAACGTAVITDSWEGIDTFFEPDKEFVIVESAADVARALSMSDRAVESIGTAARARALEEHSARRRAAELVAYIRDYTPARHSRITTPPAGGSDPHHSRTREV